MRFRKIRWNEKVLELRWETTNAQGDTEKHEITSRDAPTSDFTKALQKLAVPMCELLGVGGKFAKGLIIRSVAIDYKDEEQRGLVISGVAGVRGSNAPFSPDTPRILEQDGEPVVEETWQAVSKIENEAIRYYNGHRVQQTLDEEAA